MLNNNSLAFIAICNEYCYALENAADSPGRQEFVAEMLRLLPRLYITASDLSATSDDDTVSLQPDDEEIYIESSLDEDYYDSVRRGIEALLGPDDGYLEVFMEDMKYSDTPIYASISETLADIFQPIYNFTEMAKNLPADQLPALVMAARDEFQSYWSQPLCNVLRPLNNLRFKEEEE